MPSLLLFPKPLFSLENSSLIIQYEVKLQEGLHCGGAHISLFRAPLDAAVQLFRPERLSDQTPFSLSSVPIAVAPMIRYYSLNECQMTFGY